MSEPEGPIGQPIDEFAFDPDSKTELYVDAEGNFYDRNNVTFNPNTGEVVVQGTDTPVSSRTIFTDESGHSYFYDENNNPTRVLASNGDQFFFDENTRTWRQEGFDPNSEPTETERALSDAIMTRTYEIERENYVEEFTNRAIEARETQDIAPFLDFLRDNDPLTRVDRDGNSAITPTVEAALMDIFDVETAEELAHALAGQGYHVRRLGNQIVVDFGEPRNIEYDENGDLVINEGTIEDWGDRTVTPTIGDVDDEIETNYHNGS